MIQFVDLDISCLVRLGTEEARKTANENLSKLVDQVRLQDGEDEGGEEGEGDVMCV